MKHADRRNPNSPERVPAEAEPDQTAKCVAPLASASGSARPFDPRRAGEILKQARAL